MDWLIDIPDFIKSIGDTPFKVLVVAAMFWMIYEFRSARKETNKELGLLRAAVAKLHEAIAVIIERTASHEKRISRLETRKK
jgi:hypothetical protein